MDVIGKAAHSGGNFERGHSAINALAHKTLAIAALTDLSIGVTLNIGLVSGGQSVNTVAPSAEGQIDMRYARHADRDRIFVAIEEIIATEHVHTAGNAALLEIYQKAAKRAGLALEGEATGGCADSGFTSAVGAPTLCATGPVGGAAHSPEEYLEVESVVPRAMALADAVSDTAPLKG
jgi:glutamate carboxypeptidase